MKTICVQRGTLGTTKYYIAKMPAGELVDSVGLAVELPEWKDMTADEKMQREPDLNRVVTEICPYITEDPDRFFGCIIIDIYSGFEDMIYEPLTDVVPQLSAAYSMPLKDVGFLTLPGNERLIALDGQHRCLGLKLCIKGSSAISAQLLGNKKMTAQMQALVPHPDLAKEEICVIFVEHTDNQKIRKIFNKVNKYARQTGRGQNIITNDDDAYAYIARKLFSDGEVLEKINDIELVNWKSNTLSQRSKQLTTVSSLYTIAEILLRDREWSIKSMPDEEDLRDGYEVVKAFWQELLAGIAIYKTYIELSKNDSPVGPLREKSLLMKPVTHMALAHCAYLAAKKGIDWADIVKKLDKVDWSFDNQLWFNILVIGSANKKMITGKESVKAAGLVISYMVMGEKMTTSEVNEVKEIIRNSTNGTSEKLPEIVQ